MRLALAAFFALGFVMSDVQAQEKPPVEPTPIPAAIAETIAKLKQTASESSLAYDITRDLAVNVGPRMAGTEAEARARDWAVAKLKVLGFENVRTETFPIGMWRRVSDRAVVTAPFPQPLAISALGGSAPTPEGGLEAEIVRYPDMAALRAAPDADVKGKIVFLDEKMRRGQDGSTYGFAVAKRRQCPEVANAKGAAGCLIRTVGTSEDRVANTGNITRGQFRGPIPAAALSNPDADEITALLARGSVRVRLDIAVETKEGAPSGNVIGEIKGREKPDEIVIIGAHLDSWDLSQGAQDDAAGVGIAVATAKLIASLPKKPRRTIRVVLYGSEEVGLLGAFAYADAHRAELPKHVLGFESDFGAGAVWQVRTKFGNPAHAEAVNALLADLAIAPSDRPASGSSDVGVIVTAGVPAVDMIQDGYSYFDIHHTVNDTMDRIPLDALRQNVAAAAAVAYLAAESDWDFRAAPK